MSNYALLPPQRAAAAAIGDLAVDCLKREVATYPKPGLVSHIDNGAHHDMDAKLLNRSAETLRPFFVRLAEAGAAGGDMDRLRIIGIEAERVMLAATGGINTHRGAIFGMGLLAAAAGFRDAYGLSAPLGNIVAARWGAQIAAGPVMLHSHGAAVSRRYGAGGARAQAAAGFPALYTYGLPALRLGRSLAPRDAEAARVQLCMALIAKLEDTNLLHRGGLGGLTFARRLAMIFLAQGGVGHPDWRRRAKMIHEAFVTRRLSPGGSADLLAMTLFTDACEAAP
jgi:triphosphoribosyl-dephospho-CoA synthase